ncbi:MAG: hypothetical protein ACPGN3_01335 [Opitutales bacterium]
MNHISSALLLASISITTSQTLRSNNTWHLSSEIEWKNNIADIQGAEITNGQIVPAGESATLSSQYFDAKNKLQARSLTVAQSTSWDNWNKTPNIGPKNLGDAPVLLSQGPGNYWIFGRFNPANGANPKRLKQLRKSDPEAAAKLEAEANKPFNGQEANLEGFDIPLRTTQIPNTYNAPGGLKPGLGGYHAWQSRDMVNWVHHGPITDREGRWVTTAEYADGKTYIYYDNPNDQDPHLYIDSDLTDGEPGENLGMVWADPSHGSDCVVIRDLEGEFHLIYEDWSPINASAHAWDSPLAGRAVSPDGGLTPFTIREPAVDHRTQPTGEFGEFRHPHWGSSSIWKGGSHASYEKHEPAQNAYGDWAAISIGGQYYLFGDFHPAGEPTKNMSVAILTADSVNGPFELVHSVGKGHPDPDIIFAENQFYLATQQQDDFVSPGPWVESVEARVGVDTNGDKNINRWTDWAPVKETYEAIPGFSKQIKRNPAQLNLSDLPEGYGFKFEIRIQDNTSNNSKPIIDSITVNFE